MEELTYLANVLMSGASRHGRRFTLAQAAEAAIATVALGAILALRDPHQLARDGMDTPTSRDLAGILSISGADGLFLRAGGALKARGAGDSGFITSFEEVETILTSSLGDDD